MIIINNTELPPPTEKRMSSRDPSTKTKRSSSKSSKKKSGSRRSSRDNDKSSSSSSSTTTTTKSSSAPQSPIERRSNKPRRVSKTSTYSIGAGRDKEGNDHFPDLLNFDDDDFTDLTDVDTDDEFAIAAQKEKYTSKVNQDVAVFMALAERMSMESLIFILQGQVAGLSPNIKPKPSKANKNKTKQEATKAPKAKKFRFAEVAENKVREVVHEIDSYKDMDLWWSDEEMRSMRTDAIKIVKFYSKHADHYVNAVEDVFVGGKDQTKIASQLKVLVDESYVRGFEAHIVTLLNDRRELFCRAILALADELHSQDYETSSKILGEACEKHSVLAKEFALRLGQIDHLEALKSSLSR